MSGTIGNKHVTPSYCMAKESGNCHYFEFKDPSIDQLKFRRSCSNLCMPSNPNKLHTGRMQMSVYFFVESGG